MPLEPVLQANIPGWHISIRARGLPATKIAGIWAWLCYGATASACFLRWHVPAVTCVLHASA